VALARLLDGARHRHERREMEDGPRAEHGAGDRGRVAHVALDELGARRQVLRPAARQVVEDPHRMAAIEQRRDEVGADEPGPARD
jgi:hypothetical protein